MDLLQLEHFLAVVDEGTFTRAAERVCRTQPAVSQSIKKLEEEVGAPLFARDLNDVTLTAAGRSLTDYARRIVSLRDAALRHVTDLRTLKTGTLRIAAHETAAVYLLPPVLRAYLDRFPGITLEVQRHALAEIPRKVMDREVDFGFIEEDVLFHELQMVDFYRDELVCIAPAGHRFTTRTGVSIRELNGERVVIHHSSSATRTSVLGLFERHGVMPRIAAELWSLETIKGFVREGVGVAFVPAICVRQDLEAGVLARIRVHELAITGRTLMIYREQGHVSDCARGFIDIISSARHDRRPQVRGPVAVDMRRPLRRRA